MEVIYITTESDSNYIELNIPGIISKVPLLVQIQSSSNDLYVKQYFITEMGKVRVYLNDILPAGSWMFNVMYYM